MRRPDAEDKLVNAERGLQRASCQEPPDQPARLPRRQRLRDQQNYEQHLKPLDHTFKRLPHVDRLGKGEQKRGQVAAEQERHQARGEAKPSLSYAVQKPQQNCGPKHEVRQAERSHLESAGKWQRDRKADPDQMREAQQNESTTARCNQGRGPKQRQLRQQPG